MERISELKKWMIELERRYQKTNSEFVKKLIKNEKKNVKRAIKLLGKRNEKREQ